MTECDAAMSLFSRIEFYDVEPLTIMLYRDQVANSLVERSFPSLRRSCAGCASWSVREDSENIERAESQVRDVKKWVKRNGKCGPVWGKKIGNAE